METGLDKLALRRNRKIDGDAFRPDVFTQIAGLDFAAVLDLDRRDVGTDRADVVGDRFAEQGTGFFGGANSPAGRCGRSRRHPRCGWR
jgi:hypothetical protein